MVLFIVTKDYTMILCLVSKKLVIRIESPYLIFVKIFATFYEATQA